MSTPIIDIADLSKFYGKVRGIEHVNLQIDDGEIFGIIGAHRFVLQAIYPKGHIFMKMQKKQKPQLRKT